MGRPTIYVWGKDEEAVAHGRRFHVGAAAFDRSRWLAEVGDLRPSLKLIGLGIGAGCAEDEYLTRVVAELAHRDKLAPGELLAADMRFTDQRNNTPHRFFGHVEDGDCLVCECGKAPCHRAIVAHVLSSAGWSVWLDGHKYSTET